MTPAPEAARCPELVPPTWPSALPAEAEPTRVYVAAAQEDYLRARAAIELITKLGGVVTHDWTYEVEVSRDRPPSPAERATYARLDLDGVHSADVVLCLTPETPAHGCGLYAELGMGVALRKRVIVTGTLRARCIFAELAEMYRTDVEGVAACLM